MCKEACDSFETFSSLQHFHIAWNISAKLQFHKNDAGKVTFTGLSCHHILSVQYTHSSHGPAHVEVRACTYTRPLTMPSTLCLDSRLVKRHHNQTILLQENATLSEVQLNNQHNYNHVALLGIWMEWSWGVCEGVWEETCYLQEIQYSWFFHKCFLTYLFTLALQSLCGLEELSSFHFPFVAVKTWVLWKLGTVAPSFLAQ